MATEEEQFAINKARLEKAFNEAKNDLDRKYAKESYLQPDRSIKSQIWQKHFATDLYIQYKDYIRGTVADLGCNFGWWSASISKFEHVDRIFGYDISTEAINHANTFIKSEIPKTSHKLEFVASNLLDLPCEDEMFDFAFSCHVLEHIYPEDVAQFMDEMCRTVKPGGYVLMNIPEKNSCRWEPTHVYHPDLAEMDSLFVSRGFTVVESYAKPLREWRGPSLNMTGLYKKNSSTSTKQNEKRNT